jgi:hypothetical protein
MNILKTSALAAVLALGSLSAHAEYQGTDSMDITINAANLVSVQFEDSNIAFDDVVPGDALTGSINVDITGDSSNTMECSLNGQDITSTSEILNVAYDSTGDGTDDTQAASLTFTLDSCSHDDTTPRVLSITGTVGANIGAGATASETFTLAVSYAANTSISGANT